MPYTKKAHNFFAGCAHGMKPNKKGLKCPPRKEARRMMSEGIKSNRPKKNRHGFY